MTRLLDILKTFSANSRQICRLAPIALLCALMIGVCFTNDAYAKTISGGGYKYEVPDDWQVAGFSPGDSTDNQTQENPYKDYYKKNNYTAVDLKDSRALKLLQDSYDNLSLFDQKNATAAITLLQELATYTGAQGYDKFSDLAIYDKEGISIVEKKSNTLRSSLDKIVKDGGLTEDQMHQVLDEVANILKTGGERAAAAAKATEQNLLADIKYKKSIENTAKASQALIRTPNCPTTDLLRAKYSSGCWSCLVVEKLSSAFMTAASKAYSIAQRAGLVLLGLGAVLWILVWGLRNVSSLTQLEPGNILNELLKFGFKVALAYLLITFGLKVVGTYFINPIMGVGAKIAETFWDKDQIKPYTENYVWDDIDEEEVRKEEQAAMQAHSSNVEQEPVKGLTDEQKNLLNAQKEADKAKEEQDIPTFLVPGTNTGHLTSPVGCRIRPKVKCTGSSKQVKDSEGNCYGSSSHMGLDIGTSGKEGGVVFAMAGGKLTYFGGPGSSAGYAASIQTKDKYGNIWTHRYMHMQGRSHSAFVPSGSIVATGQQIGFIGNTGGSSSAHLHVEIRFTGTWKGKKYNDTPLDPLRLVAGVFYPLSANKCNGKNVDTFHKDFKSGMQVPAKGWKTSDKAVLDLSSTYITGNQYDGMPTAAAMVTAIPDIKYTGPTDIISKSVMNSILGATRAIGNITSENMILGEAIICYASLDKGGAWHFLSFVLTNGVMVIEGMFIWFTGMLLTLAIAYYLIDISFKLGFAVVALPIAIGLWPFELTKDKFGTCISIIAKSAATFAFLAITTTFTVQLTDAVYTYEDVDGAAEQHATDVNAPRGLAKLYSVYDRAALNDAGSIRLSDSEIEEDIAYASEKLALFSTTFVLLLFAFLYSYKLVRATVPDLVNKFFSDKAFGNEQPMHHLATAASKLVSTATKPLKWAGDVAMYQGGRFVKNRVSARFNDLRGKGSGKHKTLGGRTARFAGGITQFTGAAMSFLGAKSAGAAVNKAGQKVSNFGNAMDKKYNKFATRNNEDKKDDKSNASKDGGGK